MGSDDLFKKRINTRSERSSKQLEIRPEKWLFVCEGSKTEPIYIEKIIKYYMNKTNKKINYHIEGKGKNTESLVRSVDEYIDFVDEKKRDSDIKYGKVFTVFDKDSFKDDHFNNAIFLSNKKGFLTLWSNECFELWFILHFQFMDCNIGREQYYNILNEKLGCKYNKSEDYFDKLDSDNNLGFAVNNAKKLYSSLQHITSFSKKCPSTMVFILIEELDNYFGITR